MHYRWQTLAKFNAWHDRVCVALNIPYPGRNAATGDIDPDAQWTLRYADVIEVAADDWRADIDDDIAVNHPDGLGVPCDPPPAIEQMPAA